MHTVSRKNIISDNLIRILIVTVVLASIKSIFTDTGFDNSYSMAMSYRHLNGDRLFSTMWEPHQTSIFITDFLMFIYHLFVPSYAGVMIFLQVCGTAIFAAICIPLYKLLSPLIGKNISILACIFLFMARAKQTPFPEFSNLQIAFSVLLFLSITNFIMNQERKYYLFISALCLCFEILSYPSCILAYVAVAIILFTQSERKYKNLLLFTLYCGIFGILYLSYFLINIGPASLMQTISNIYGSDSHSDYVITNYQYFYGFITYSLWGFVCFFTAKIVQLLSRKIGIKVGYDLLPVAGILMLLSETVMLFLQKKTGIDWTCSIYVLPLLLSIIGLTQYSNMSIKEKNIWLSGQFIAIASMIATGLLTDLGLITILAYFVLGGVVSFIPISHCSKNSFVFLFAICMLLTIHRGLVVWGYANKGNVWMVYNVEQIQRKGPCAGIVSDYMTYYIAKTDLEEHPQYISPADNVMFVTDYLLDPQEFMLAKGGISNCSTIDTPVYTESTIRYFEIYPEKRPDVIAVNCWFDTAPTMPEDSLIMQWIYENYEVFGSGSYWRYYRPKS